MDYENLINMVRACYYHGKKKDLCWFAMNISNLPFDMAKVIWPENTKDAIIDVFVTAYRLTDTAPDGSGITCGLGETIDVTTAVIADQTIVNCYAQWKRTITW